MPENLNGETRLIPIIGDPVKHAKSPQRLSQGFQARSHNALCVPMEVAEPDLDIVMRGLAAVPNVTGLLVTMPHKFTTFPYCATSTERARLLGGVSVLRRNADGSWHGDTMDGAAFVKAQIDQGAKPQGARVLLVGAGAAGSAIAVALLDAGVRELIIRDADESRTITLLARLAGDASGRAKSGPADPTGCDMVCNATPLGMEANDPLPLDVTLFRPSMFVGDVIAGHGTTPLLRAAQAAGCRIADGVQMVEAVQTMMLDFLLGN